VVEADATSVMVVDDEPGMARAVSRQLRSQGFAVTTCLTGEEAVARLQQETPDVVVTDLVMGGTDGVEVCRAASSLPVPPIIVFMSAKEDVHERIRALDAGASDFLVKPFEFAELLARIRAHLRVMDQGRNRGKLTHGPISLDARWGTVAVAGQPAHLSPLQVRLLACLLATPGQAVSFQDLRKAAGVAGDDGAVRKQVERLRAALGEAGTAICTVRGVGYRLGLAEQ